MKLIFLSKKKQKKYLKFFLLTVSFFLFIWLGISTAGYFYIVKTKGYNKIRYLEVVFLPYYFEQYRKKIGNYQIEEGIELFERKKYYEGFKLVRIGLSRAPENKAGRKFLIMLYKDVLQNYDVVKKLLQEGLQRHFSDIDYLTFFFKTLSLMEENKLVFDAAKQLLESEDAQLRSFGAIFFAQACFKENRLDCAKEMLDKFNLEEQVEGVLLKAKLISLQERGFQEKIDYLTHHLNAFDYHPLLYEELIRSYFENDQKEEGLLATYDYFKRSEKTFKDYLLLIEALWLNEKKEEKTKAWQALLERHGQNEQGLRKISQSNFFAKEKEGSYLLYEQGIERASVENIRAYTFGLFNVWYENKAFEKILTSCASFSQEVPIWAHKAQCKLSAYAALSYFAKGDTLNGQLHLNKALQEEIFLPEADLFQISSFFYKQGNLEACWALLNKNCEKRTPSLKELALILELEIALDKRSQVLTHSQTLLENINLSPAYQSLLIKIYHYLVSDKHYELPEKENILRHVKNLIENYS